MSRSGYSEDCDIDWHWIMFRGQVMSAINGRRGQAFLRELIEALDALPEKVLIVGELQDETGAVCAIGSVGLKRGIPMTGVDQFDHKKLGETFGIAGRMVQEIEFENDEALHYDASPERRWQSVRAWAVERLKP